MLVTGEKLSISRATRLVGLGLSLLLGGLELAAVLSPREDWPFSSAPMFARYQRPRAPLYYIEWYVKRGREREPLSPQRDLGIGELPFRRGYFAAYYGSTDPRHPGGHFRDDNEAAFLARQGDYCRRLRAAWERRTGAASPDFELVVAEGRGEQRARAVSIGSCRPDGFVRSP